MQRKMEFQQRWKENSKQEEWIGDITPEEVEKHNQPGDCWCIFRGYVYKMDQYLTAHPGGSRWFVAPEPRDITNKYLGIHRHVDIGILEKLKIGKIVIPQATN